ncbi:hypothetical protein QFZ76_008598 [Streptomyces sp. V4I2]|nr:hypothetical protein [Streptomyces sp. V4I2]
MGSLLLGLQERFFTLSSRPRVTGLWAARDHQASYAQELVFIGTQLDADGLRAALTACLLRPAEPGPPADPFPAWDTYGIDEACEYEHEAEVSAV